MRSVPSYTGNRFSKGMNYVKRVNGVSREKTSKTLYFLSCLIIIATLLAYSSLPWNKFIIFDDPEYITDNANILDGLTLDGISWAFCNVYQYNWHPLTWLSHMLDIQLFGLNPMGHHLTSLLIHIANSTLVLLILHKMTGRLYRSAFVAIMFAVHPLHVESVAWVAERKDLLCAMFWLLTMLSYFSYAQLPNWKRYLLVMLSFALGIMSKPMIVTLPCILLLLDYWPLQRKTGIVALVTEKLPLLLMSAGCSIIYYRAQRGCAMPALHDTKALMNAVQSYTTYMWKTFWPTDLAVLYPFDENRLTIFRSTSAASLLIVITIIVLIQIRNRPYLFVGWFWYLIALVPVIGFFRIGYHAFADRYTYLPHIGIFMILGWGFAELQPASDTVKRIGIGILAIIGGALCLLTYKQVERWKNTITLLEHTSSVTENNWFVSNILGCAYVIIGTNVQQLSIAASLPMLPDTPERRTVFLKKAAKSFEKALRIKPYYHDAAINLKYTDNELEQLERQRLNSGVLP